MTRQDISSLKSRVTSNLVPLGLYFLIAAFLMWPNLIHLTSRSVYPYGDAVQMIWANGWVAHAITHFHNPLFSPNLMAPHGTNLLAMPCAVGLAVLFSPITWLLGAVASFNLQLLFMPVVSAAAFYFAGRNLVASRRALWLGGLLWGFSPIVLSSLNIGWTNVGYQFFIPLILSLIVDELYLHHRSSWRNGLYIGLLVAVQITVGSENVAIAAIGIGCLLALALGIHVVRQRSLRHFLPTSWPRFLFGFSTVTLLVALPLALYAVIGPSHLADWVWEESTIRANHMRGLGEFVGTKLSSLNPFLPPMGANPTYFGWVLVVGLLVAAIYSRRDTVTRVGAFVVAVGVWLSLGESVPISLWKIFYNLPLIHNILAPRCVVWVWFGAALILTSAVNRFVSEPRLPRPAKWLPQLIVVALVGWGVTSFGAVFPVNSTPIQEFRAATRLGHDHPQINILTWPFSESGLLMVQQTVDGFTTTSPSTFGPSIRSVSMEEQTISYSLSNLSRFGIVDKLLKSRTGRQRIRDQIKAWKVRDIVVPITIREPLAAFATPTPFQVHMTRLYGLPTILNGSFVWNVARSEPPLRMPHSLRILYCLSTTEKHPERLPACLLGG